jgi:hypothetical protein
MFPKFYFAEYFGKDGGIVYAHVKKTQKIIQSILNQTQI